MPFPRPPRLASEPGPPSAEPKRSAEPFRTASPPGAIRRQTTRGLHLRAEAIWRAFRDRFTHLGDPAVVKAPWDQLASKAYAQTIAADLRRPTTRDAGGREGSSARNPTRSEPS